MAANPVQDQIKTEETEKYGAPLKYNVGDGFTRHGFLGKAAYILLFPTSSIIMEVMAYNDSKHALEAKEHLDAAAAAGTARRAPAYAHAPEQEIPGKSFVAEHAMQQAQASQLQR